MCKNVKQYFLSGQYQLHLFYLMGFTKKEYATYKIVSVSKNRNRLGWLFNNLAFPLLVIISPWILTWVHYYFGTIKFNKTIVEILIGGSVTLLGINVLRTTSTSVADKLDEPKVPMQYNGQLDTLYEEINAIKNKLDRRSWILTFLGWGMYLLQIGQFVDTSRGIIYFVIFFAVILMLVSVIHGRFIYLMKTNLFNQEKMVSLLFSKLLSQGDEYNDLENQLKNLGI